MRSRDELKAAVARGVKRLESKIGPHWRDYVSLREFDFNNPCKCVVGLIGCSPNAPQMESGWTSGLKMLGVKVDYSEVRTSHGPAYYGYDFRDYSEIPTLQALWVKVLKEKPTRLITR